MSGAWLNVATQMDQVELVGLVDIREEELNNDTEIIPAASIVLDLPNPWEITSWAQKSLRIGFLNPTVDFVVKVV